MKYLQSSEIRSIVIALENLRLAGIVENKEEIRIYRALLENAKMCGDDDDSCMKMLRYCIKNRDGK